MGYVISILLVVVGGIVLFIKIKDFIERKIYEYRERKKTEQWRKEREEEEEMKRIEEERRRIEREKEEEIKRKLNIHADKVGQRNYKFAGINWRVLDSENKNILLLSEDILEVGVPYHTDKGAITWESCSMRKYLNSEFINNNFKPAERDKIQITAGIKNNGSLWSNANGGRNTNDKIFLLSVEEVDYYFGNSGDYLNKRRKNGAGQNDKYSFFLYNQYNEDRIATYKDEALRWFLRTTDDDFVSNVSENGSINVGGGYANDKGLGIRPALWITC